MTFLRLCFFMLFCIALSDAPALADAHANTETTTDEDQSEKPQIRLRIGVRSEARPFSYKSETLRDVITDATPGVLAKKHYTGYMVRICDEVLNQMILEPGKINPLLAEHIALVDIDALREAENDSRSRFEYLRPSLPEDEPKIDILCDPATITNDRRFGLIISAPVYLTGISYIQREGTAGGGSFDEDHNCPLINSDGTKPIFLFGLVGNTTAGSFGIRKLIDANEVPQGREVLINYLKPDSPQCKGKNGNLARQQGIHFKGGVRYFPTHAQAAEAFCKGEITFYIGDREIITAHANIHPDCGYIGGTQTYTTDRYAIFGRIDYDADQADRAMLVARFFEILSQKIVGNPSILDKAFDYTFQASEPTPALDLFFRAVRGAR